MSTLFEARGIRVGDNADDKASQMLPGPVDLRLASGDFAVITGPSGSGKSTLLRCLAMLEPRAHGRVWFRGEEVQPAGVPSFRNRVCYVAQQAAILPMTVEESLRHAFAFANATGSYERKRAENLFEELHLPNRHLQQRIAELSGGERQRVALVRCLLANPDVLLLDEPMSALDEDARHAMAGCLLSWKADGERAAVMVSHHAQEATALKNRRLVLDGSLTEEAP